MKYFGEFIKYAIPYKWRLIASVVFNLLGTIFAIATFVMATPFLQILFGQEEAISEPMPFSFSKDVIIHNFNYFLSQIVVNQGPQKALLVVSCIVVGAVLLKSFFNYMGNYTFVPIRTGIIKDIRNRLYNKIIYLPMQFFSEERKGDLISRMIGDIKELEGTVVNSLQKGFKSPIQLIGFLAILFTISSQLTIIVLLLLPVTGLLIGRLAKNLRKKAVKGQQKLGNILINIEETLFGVRIIKAFTGEQKAKSRFQKENNSYTNIMNKVLRKKFLAHPISEFVGTLVIVFIMLYGGSMVLDQSMELSPEAFITYIIIFTQILPPAKSLSNLYFDINKGMAAYQRVREVLMVDESIKNSANAQPITSFENSIEYKDVTFGYTKQQEVLKNINIEIKKGQSVAIVGQSGAGKSTLVDLLPRFYDVTNGAVQIDGKPIKAYKIESLRQLIGIVSQEQILFNDTIFNNIAFGVKNASEESVIKAAKVANAHDFIMNTENGYDTVIGDRGSKLSGGQRQRITIARAILVNPPILILDEATSALDVESEKLVQQALDHLMQNRTSIVIAHRLSTVKNADMVYVMQDGKIIESGRHNELLKTGGAFKDLYQQQMT